MAQVAIGTRDGEVIVLVQMARGPDAKGLATTTVTANGASVFLGLLMAAFREGGRLFENGNEVVLRGLDVGYYRLCGTSPGEGCGEGYLSPLGVLDLTLPEWKESIKATRVETDGVEDDR